MAVVAGPDRDADTLTDLADWVSAERLTAPAAKELERAWRAGAGARERVVR